MDASGCQLDAEGVSEELQTNSARPWLGTAEGSSGRRRPSNARAGEDAACRAANILRIERRPARRSAAENKGLAGSGIGGLPTKPTNAPVVGYEAVSGRGVSLDPREPLSRQPPRDRCSSSAVLVEVDGFGGLEANNSMMTLLNSALLLRAQASAGPSAPPSKPKSSAGWSSNGP